MILNWRDGVRGEAPFEIYRGAALVDGNMAYFMTFTGELCFYNSSDKKWNILPKCPYKHSSLAVINSHLTAIGGFIDFMFKEATCTNKLLTLPDYQVIFPLMPTRRWNTTAVTAKEHLIVAGGETSWYVIMADAITAVEIMNTDTLVWSKVASLPHPCFKASLTIFGDRIYMLGGVDNQGKTKSVLTCSLTELLQSSSSSLSIWHRVADAPAYWSTCAAVNGKLLAVGGCYQSCEPTSAIHEYNPTTNSWDLISNMQTARYLSFVAALPTNEMMVVGGGGE